MRLQRLCSCPRVGVADDTLWQAELGLIPFHLSVVAGPEASLRDVPARSRAQTKFPDLQARLCSSASLKIIRDFQICECERER